jgi:hypothetical protein
MRRREGIAVLLAVLGLVLLLPQQSTAAVVWTEDFSSGFSDWTIGYGNWEVINGYLRHNTDTEPYAASISRESNQTVGTWSFDAKIHSSTTDWHAIYLFMANGSVDDYYGYGIRMSVSSLFLIRQSGGTLSAASLGFLVIENLASMWFHLDVTRNATGTLKVWVDAHSDEAPANITFTDNTYTESTHFVVRSLGSYMANIDNITVNDQFLINEPETEPTTTTTTSTATTTTSTTTPANGGGGQPPISPLLLAAGGGAVVVLLVVVIVLKRR